MCPQGKRLNLFLPWAFAILLYSCAALHAEVRILSVDLVDRDDVPTLRIHYELSGDDCRFPGTPSILVGTAETSYVTISGTRECGENIVETSAVPVKAGEEVMVAVWGARPENIDSIETVVRLSAVHSASRSRSSDTVPAGISTDEGWIIPALADNFRHSETWLDAAGLYIVQQARDQVIESVFLRLGMQAAGREIGGLVTSFVDEAQPVGTRSEGRLVLFGSMRERRAGIYRVFEVDADTEIFGGLLILDSRTEMPLYRPYTLTLRYLGEETGDLGNVRESDHDQTIQLPFLKPGVPAGHEYPPDRGLLVANVPLYFETRGYYQLSLRGQPLPRGAAPLYLSIPNEPGWTTWYLAVTSARYGEGDDLATAVEFELGSKFVIAGWEDLLPYSESIDSLLDSLGVGTGEILLLTYRGQRFDLGPRHFFLARGSPHAGASVFDRFGNSAWLGSWYGYRNLRVLAKAGR